MPAGNTATSPFTSSLNPGREDAPDKDYDRLYDRLIAKISPKAARRQERDRQFGLALRLATKNGYPKMADTHAAARTVSRHIVTDLASDLHNQWRASRKLPDGTYEPRWKDTPDGPVDIANTDYRDLPAEWQAENKAAAEGALRIVAGSPNADLETHAAQVHEDWLSRNGSWAEPHQKLPYGQLSEEEKEKDREVARAARNRWSQK